MNKFSDSFKSGQGRVASTEFIFFSCGCRGHVRLLFQFSKKVMSDSKVIVFDTGSIINPVRSDDGFSRKKIVSLPLPAMVELTTFLEKPFCRKLLKMKRKTSEKKFCVVKFTDLNSKDGGKPPYFPCFPLANPFFVSILFER